MNEAKENKLLSKTAAIHGSIPILEKLANAGVDFNLPDAYGWTPGQLAAQFGHTEAESWIKRSIARKALRAYRACVPSTFHLSNEDSGCQKSNTRNLPVALK